MHLKVQMDHLLRIAIICLSWDHIPNVFGAKFRLPLSEIEVLDVTWRSIMILAEKNHPERKPTVEFYDSLFSIVKRMAMEHSKLVRGHTRNHEIPEMQDRLERALENQNLPEFKEELTKTLLGFYQLYPSEKDEAKNKTLPASVSDDVIETLSEATAEFLAVLARDIGDEIYSHILAAEGFKTLVFVIDVTGSMKSEIAAAKKIATSIVKGRQAENVDYILSAFSDPDVKPPIKSSSSHRDQFIQAIEDLRPTGGGDCSEMAIGGILEGLKAGPRHGSPVIVFTDASPKDATPQNMHDVTNLALDLGVSIYFFTAYRGCERNSTKMQPFEELSELTNGHVFGLRDYYELTKMGDFVKDSLKSRTLLDVVSNGSNIDSIPFKIDDTIDILDISIRTNRVRVDKLIKLFDPDGTVLRPSLVLTDSVHYKIQKPTPGQWNITVSQPAGVRQVTVKGSGQNVIDFDYMFTVDAGEGITIMENPILDRETTVRVIVGGMQLVHRDSLFLEMVNNAGHTIGSPTFMYPVGTEGNQFEAYLHATHDSKFRLQLRGITGEGNPFIRIGRRYENPKRVFLHVLFARSYFAVKEGGETFAVVELRNFGIEEQFNFTSTSHHGSAYLTISSVNLQPDHRGFTGLHFNVSSSLHAGRKAEVKIQAVGQKSGTVATTTVEFTVTI